MSWTSARKGAMKRGLGSQGLGVYVNAKHDGVISVYEFEPGWPLDRPPLVVSHMSRSTYSFTARSPLFGSTRVSPPSPPKGKTIFAPVAGESSDSPLSCRPPQIASPPVTFPEP